MRSSGRRLVVVGLSYRTAPISQREKAALDADGVRGLLRGLSADPSVCEAAALSTCNRTEVYVVCADAQLGRQAAERALVACSRISPAELAYAQYALYDDAAARHLFRVTGGLDSMVLGESEVQGQVRAAAQLAREAEAIGPKLGALFRQALAAGGRVRRETRIAGGPMSVSSVAVSIARRAFEDLASRQVLLIGAGRMAESTGRALRRHGARELAVANRTLSAADALAADLDARAVGLDSLDQELAWADMAVCSTDAPHPLVCRGTVACALAGRPERPLLLIDLAVPRDVEPEVASMSGVLLYDIDDMERAMKETLEGRRRELTRAEAIVTDEVARFRAWSGAAVRPRKQSWALGAAVHRDRAAARGC